MFEIIFLCLGIIIISIFWWSRSPVPFEVPKVIFFQWFVKALALIYIASVFVRRMPLAHRAYGPEGKINLKLFIPILIFVIWATLSSVLGHDVPKSFIGNYYRDDGLVTLYSLIGFAILVSYFWQDKFKKIISSTFFVSSTLLSILALSEIVTHKFGLGFAATFGNPVFLAGYLAVSTPFSLYLFRSTNRKIYLVGLTVQSLAIILIGAISSILTLIIFVVLYVIANVVKQSRSIKFIFISILSLVFLSILFFWAKNFFYIKDAKTLSYESRERIFQNVIRGAIKNPVFGYGWANVDYAFEAGGWPMKFVNDVYVDKAHSEILEVFATTGIPGLAIYLSFIFFLIKELIAKYKQSGSLIGSGMTDSKVWDFTLLSVVILYLFHAQTNVISIMEEIVFWLVFGISLVI